jgi:hypothetical protein
MHCCKVGFHTVCLTYAYRYQKQNQLAQPFFPRRAAARFTYDKCVSRNQSCAGKAGRMSRVCGRVAGRSALSEPTDAIPARRFRLPIEARVPTIS